jgi:hypothetical protein
MRCRAVICASCCTRVDGINHCHACLKALAGQPAKRRRRSPWFGVSLIVLSVWGVLVGLLLLARGGLAP